MFEVVRTPPGVDYEEINTFSYCFDCDEGSDVTVFIYNGFGEWVCEFCGYTNEYQREL